MYKIVNSKNLETIDTIAEDDMLSMYPPEFFYWATLNDMYGPFFADTPHSILVADPMLQTGMAGICDWVTAFVYQV